MAKQGTFIASKTYLKYFLDTPNLSIHIIFRINSFPPFEKDLFDFTMFSDNNTLNKQTKL